MKSNQKNTTILLGILLAVGFFLRLFELGAENLWLDEGVTVYYARLSLAEIFSRISTEEFNPPLYYSLIHVWIRLAGDSEFSLRMPSVIFGVLSILMIYKTARLMAGRDVGLLAAMILALNRFHVHYSQEARIYALLVFLTLLSFYYFIRLTKEFHWKPVLGYLVASFFLMHTHVYALFIILTQNLYFILRWFQTAGIQQITLKRWLALQLGLLLLFLPWLTVLVNQFLRVQKGFWIDKPPFYWILGAFLRYAGWYNVLSGIFSALLFFLACRAILKWENRKVSWRRTQADWNGLLVIWAATSILIPFVLSHMFSPIYHIKYTIAASLAYYILIAKGIMLLHSQHFKRTVIGIIILISLTNMYLYYASLKKECWREVAQYVESAARKNDLVLFVAGYCLEGVYEYYANDTNLIKKPFPQNVRNVDDTNIAELEPLLENHERVWLILSHNDIHDPKNLTFKTLDERLQRTKQKIFRGKQKYLLPTLNVKIQSYFEKELLFKIEVYLFEKKGE
jgi:mannosyltransferase